MTLNSVMTVDVRYLRNNWASCNDDDDDDDDVMTMTMTFQCLSVALQRGNAGSFQNIAKRMKHRFSRLRQYALLSFNNTHSYRLPASWIITIARLPSNLKHYHPRMLHVVTGRYFRSRKKDGGDAIQSAVSKNAMLHIHTSPLCVSYRRRIIGDGIIFTLRGSGFVPTRLHPLRAYLLWTFLGPVTLTLTRLPSDTNLTRIAWSYTGCAKMNFFRQLSSDRQTDRHTYIQNRPKL